MIEFEEYDEIKSRLFTEDGRLIKPLDANSKFGQLLARIGQQERDHQQTPQKIIKKLKEKEDFLGGSQLAHGQEVKTTKFIELIFENVLKSKFDFKDIHLGPEHVIELGQKNIRPDYIIFRKD